MQIELNDDLRAVLEQRAAAAGMDVSSYASHFMQEQLQEGSQTMRRRKEAVDAFQKHMKASTACSGRGVREWRDFIHEGHDE